MDHRAVDETGFRELRSWIAKYAVDASTQAHFDLCGRTFVPISPEQFVDELYVVNEDFWEHSLLDRLARPGRLLCIVGNRGQGKTSSLYWCKRQFESGRRAGRMELIDVNRILGKSAIKAASQEGFALAFQSAVTRILAQRFFPVDTPLMSWLLAGQPDGSDPFELDLLSDFYHLSSDILSLCGAKALERQDRVASINRLLQDSALPNRVRDLVSAARRVLRPAFVLQAARSLGIASHLVLTYDNVDRMQQWQQLALLNLAEETADALSGSIRTAIAVRWETVVVKARQRGGHYSFLDLELAGMAEFESAFLPSYRLEHYERIIDTRFNWARAKAVDELGLREYHHLLDKFLTKSSLVTPLLENEQAHRLTNYSIRTFIDVYCHFADHLANFAEAARVGGDSPGHLETLFYLWLAEFGPGFGLSLYDVVQLDRGSGPMPSPHHFVLSAVLNLEDDRLRVARVGALLERLDLIGIDEERALGAIRELAGAPESGMPAVRLLQPAEGESGSYESWAIALTPCGRELVTRVYSAIGYVWGRWYLRSKEGPRKARDVYLSKKPNERIEGLITHLVDLTRQHTEFLASIRPHFRDAWGDKWMVQYRSLYGVNGTLQVERIVRSAEAFFAEHFAGQKNPFAMFRRRYRQILERFARTTDSRWQGEVRSLKNLIQHR